MKAKLTFTPIEGEFSGASTILGICKKALESTGGYAAKEEHICTREGMKHILSIEEKENCPVCHGEGATTDHHDPCSNCSGIGRI